MSRLLLKVVIVSVIIGFYQLDVFAQCAMCRATVETSLADGQTTIASGLNTGILYLLAMPYILIGVIGWLWYKNSRANARKIKVQRNY
jgi:hypothetical protein